MVSWIVRLTAGLAWAQAIPGSAAGADEFLVAQRRENLSGPRVGPAPIAIGDSGLLLLEKRDRIVPLTYFARPDGPSFPSWKGISPRYNEALEWAHAVERVLDEPDRVRADALLADLVFSRVEEIAAWSTHRLFEGGRRDALGFCERHVSSARWPLASRLAFDALLLRADATWKDSKLRSRFAAHCLTSPYTDFEAELLLVEMREPHSISQGSNARKAILAAIAGNEGLSDGVRANAIQAALQSARSGLGTPWLFEFCTRIASTSKSERVVSNALGTLAGVDLDDGQLDALRRMASEGSTELSRRTAADLLAHLRLRPRTGR